MLCFGENIILNAHDFPAEISVNEGETKNEKTEKENEDRKKNEKNKMKSEM